jgi:DNA polymerase
MDVVTTDFETYYDKDYSLSKMTTEAYIRDPRFEIIGVAVKVNGHPTDWYSGENPGKFLKSLDYSKRAILAHNCAFDGAILAWKFGIRPKLWLDTLSMARPLHGHVVSNSLKALAEHYGLGAKGDEVLRAIGKRRLDFTPQELAQYGAYCVNDVDLTYKLFLHMARGFPKDELRLIDLTMRMYTDPLIEIDTDLLTSHLQAVRERKQKLLEDFGGDNALETIMSNPKFAEHLRSLGVEPPMKTSLRTGKETYAFSKTDQDFLALQEHPDERVAVAVTTRLGAKSTIEETRTEAMLGVAERGRLPIMLNYCGAHTNRFSGGDKLNLQNLPRGGAIRRSLRAPRGCVLVASDLSQIEARMLAWLAGQEDLVESFREGRDVYCEFASTIYDREITKADKSERFVGKTSVLGMGYGIGAEKFRKTLALGQGGMAINLEPNEAKRVVNLYRQTYHKIPELWNVCGYALRAMAAGEGGNISILPFTPEGIQLPNGFTLRYPALRMTESGFSYINDPRSYKNYLSGIEDKVIWNNVYGGKCVENVVQALARVVITEQMLRIARRYRIVLQVHDEVVVVTRETQKDQAIADITKIMSTPPAWAPDLPVACDAGWGYSYGDSK